MTKGRSPAFIGGMGIMLVLLVTVSAFFLSDLPIIGAGSTFKAQFSESAGLKKGDEVRIAGVKVGKVDKVKLDGDKVEVQFKAKDAYIGDKSTASIQIKTVLGQKYLAIEPRGDEPLNPSDTIPLDRTVAPFDVVEAFSSAARTLNKIDTNQLADSFRVLSDSFSQTPPDIRSSLEGVSRLSQTIDSRNEKLGKLFQATSQTSKVLADRNEEFTKLLSSGAQLLGELNNRQQAISTLLTGTQRLSQQLTGLVRDNEQQIGPALEQLRGVVQILKDNNDVLAQGIQKYEPFLRLFTNVIGNGRWFDIVIVNLTPPGLPAIPGYRNPINILDPTRDPGAN